MSKFKYNLSIAAIMKYEEEYVEEWVKYHLIVGVKHFYIYDNNEENSYMEDVLKPYIEKGIVDLIPFFGNHKQVPAYNHCIENFMNESKYIAVIDADEFLMPIKDVPVDSVIESIFAKDEKAGGVVVKWQVYGSGFNKTKPDGLVIDNYIYVEDGPRDQYIKSIVNPRVVFHFINPHECMYINDYHNIDETGAPHKGSYHKHGTRDIIRLNHYYYKSEEEFMNNRMKRKRANSIVSDQYMKEFLEKELVHLRESNNKYDDTMARYVRRMRMFDISLL